MKACSRFPVIHCLLLALSGALAGCQEEPPEPTGQLPASLAAPRDFEPASAGSVRGRVTWEGGLPLIPPYEVRNHVLNGSPGRPRQIRANPNAPKIDPNTRGVAGAVVFLRGVSPAKARPWDHPPVRVELRDGVLHVLQGETDTRVGFVRRGDSVEVVSCEEKFHSLHARGAAFFTLAFPDSHRPRTRRLTSNGVVELTSAAGCYWMRGYLFVDEHPCYARTDSEGRFCLEGVPPGNWEVVCWLPSWVKERHERDPETSLVTRLSFRPPVERVATVVVQSGAGVQADFSLSCKDFER